MGFCIGTPPALCPPVSALHANLELGCALVQQSLSAGIRSSSLLRWTCLDNSGQTWTLAQVGAIVPWNYPFHNVFNPLSAAVFAGNAIVIKVRRQPCISLPLPNAACVCHWHYHILSACVSVCLSVCLSWSAYLMVFS